MRYLTIVLTFVLAFTAFGQSDPHPIYGTVLNPDESIPSIDCITFCAYYGTQSLCFPEDSGGLGVKYLEEYGAWFVRVDIFEPPPPEGAEIEIYFWNTCNLQGASVSSTVNYSVPSQNSGEIVLGETGIDETSRPNKTELSIHPNPFNAACIIEGASSVEIYDISGKMVNKLEGGGWLMWDGRSSLGEQLPTGIYFVRDIDTDTVRRVVFLR